MVLETILDPVFWPILKLPPLFGLIAISFMISLLVTIIYKYATDQVLMKSLREEIKVHQKKMKELRSDPKKMMESQKRVMEANMQYMMKSLKPTLYTIVPIIIIFGWLSSHYSYYPLQSSQDFNITVNFKLGSSGNVELIAPEEFEIKSEKVQAVKEQNSWILSPKQNGKYTLEVKYQENGYPFNVLITNELKYEQVETKPKDSQIDKIIIGNKKVKPFGNLSIFGWQPGWLATYIIFSIIFSLGLKKAFKLH